MSKLVAAPLVFENESPLGLIYRTSIKNSFNNTKSFFNHIGIHSSLFTVVTTEHFVKVQQKLDLVASNQALYYRTTRTDKPTYLFNKVHIDRRLLDTKKRRVCHKCTALNGYQDYAHDYLLINSCAKHQNLLSDNCLCGKSLLWSHSCECNGIKSNTKADENTLAADRQIQTWLNEGNQTCIKTLEEMYFLLEKFVRLHKLDMSSSKRTYLAQLAIINPDTFCNLLLKEVNKSGYFPRISFYPFLASKSSKLSAIAEKLLAQHDAPKAVSMPPENILLSRVEVCAILNISDTHFRQLSSLKLIDAEQKSKTGGWQVYLSSVWKLMEKLHQLVVPDKDSIPISSVLNHPLLDKSLGDIITASITHDYKVGGFDVIQGLRGLKFSNFEKPNLKKLIKKTDFITLNDASEIFGHKKEHITALLNMSLLNTYRHPAHKTLILISKEELGEFDKHYVIGPELAAQTSRSKTSFCLKLVKHGINPVTNPKTNTKGCYVFKKEDLLGVDFDEVENHTLAHIANRPGRPTKINAASKQSLPIVSFNDVKKSLNINTHQLRNLLNRRILKKHHDYIHKPAVSRVSFDELYGLINGQTYLSKTELQKTLGMTPRKFHYKFVNTGVCLIKDIYIDQLITKTDHKKIIKFHQKYLTTAEANEHFSNKANHIQNLEKQGHIKSTIFNKVNGNKRVIKLFLRKDVMKFIENN